APPRRPGARCTGRLVRGRGAHRGRRLRRQVTARARRHAYRYHDDPRRRDRHAARRGDEPGAVLGGRQYAARGTDAPVAGGSGASHGGPVLSVGGDAVSACAAHHLRAALPVRGAVMRRLEGWKVGRMKGAVLLLSILPSFPLSAQDSQFGIRGLGTPGRFETVRVRSTGGAFGPFDALSPLTEASL